MFVLKHTTKKKRGKKNNGMVNLHKKRKGTRIETRGLYNDEFGIIVCTFTKKIFLKEKLG